MESSEDDIRGITQSRERGAGISEGPPSPMVAMANPRVSSRYQQQAPQTQASPRRWHTRVAQKLERWVFLYNVTTGLYMLDWWERCICNAVFLFFFAIAGYNSGHYLQRLGAGLLAWAWCGDSTPGHEKFLAGAGADAAAGAGVG